MKLPWSISTTVRNPERLRDFLRVLKRLQGEPWNPETQIKYQIMLIQEKVYGSDNQQFYNGLTSEQIRLMGNPEPITYEQAKEIFERKNYVDPAMRGRQSINPLVKLGLAVLVKSRVKITSLGEYLLSDNYDLGEMFFRSFIKWQLPNPSNDDYKVSDGYDIKPFIGTLHLIDRVNKKWKSICENPVGISKEEFSLFAPTLINYKDIDKQTQMVVDLRLGCRGKALSLQKKIKEKYKIKLVQEFLGTKERGKVKKLLNNLKDYGDNAIRYFRLTRYIFIRGGGFYIDLEPRRQIEIRNLLKIDNAKALVFSSEEEYSAYIADIKKPELPWETEEELIKITKITDEEIHQLIKELKVQNIPIPAFSFRDPMQLNEDELKGYIGELRRYRRDINETKIRFESQEITKLEEYIQALKEIYRSERKPLELERLATLALNALNDALNIKSNYLVGDDNEPIFTAPGNKPDIECFYGLFNSVCEVTMLTDRSQWYQEGQPIMRHARDFEKHYADKNVFCLFIAPRIHRDTVNTFWNAVKYEYEGSKQRIIPLTIGQLIELLGILLQIKKKRPIFKHEDLLGLYTKIIELTNVVGQSDLWLEKIPEAINEWKESMLSKV